MRCPNLFIIGAMKSGSTSLHYYLGEHPEIFMCEPKEPWYFVKEKNWNKGEKWYKSLFEMAPPEAKIIGESSADYTMLPMYKGVPERIHQYNPNAKFIYVMRNPAMRTISHYWHNVRWHSEQRDILRAIKEDQNLIDVSNYHMQLSAFLNYFPLTRFYPLTFEEMIANPEKTVKAIFSWLKVDPSFVPSNLKEGKNITPATVEMVRGVALLHKFRFTGIWAAIHTIFPHKLRDMGKRLAVKKIDRKSQLIEPAIEYLRPIQREQIELLSTLLDRSFPEWKTR